MAFFHPNRDFKRLFFSLFSYFRDLFLKSDFYQIKEHLFAHLLVFIRKKILPPMAVSYIKKSIFRSKSKLQTLVFHFFSYSTDLSFDSDTDLLEKLSFAIFLMYIKTKFASLAQSRVFWRKICYFSRRSIFQTFVFYFFVLQRLVFQIWLWSTYKINFWVCFGSKKNLPPMTRACFF